MNYLCNNPEEFNKVFSEIFNKYSNTYKRFVIQTGNRFLLSIFSNSLEKLYGNGETVPESSHRIHTEIKYDGFSLNIVSSEEIIIEEHTEEFVLLSAAIIEGYIFNISVLEYDRRMIHNIINHIHQNPTQIYTMDKNILNIALNKLNDKLALENIYGEMTMYGGAVMCLALESRESTQDLDAVFEPDSVIKRLAGEIQIELGLPDNWLNDAVGKFVTSKEKDLFIEFSNLIVYNAPPKYMLAMKLNVSRTGVSRDISDIIALLKILNIADVDSAAEAVSKYFTDGVLPDSAYKLLKNAFRYIN